MDLCEHTGIRESNVRKKEVHLSANEEYLANKELEY